MSIHVSIHMSVYSIYTCMFIHRPVALCVSKTEKFDPMFDYNQELPEGWKWATVAEKEAVRQHKHPLCTIHAPYMHHSCTIHALHAPYMHHTCTTCTTPAPYLHLTCTIPAPYLRHFCNAHATCIRHTCNMHAAHMAYTIHAAHLNMHTPCMQHTCSTHAYAMHPTHMHQHTPCTATCIHHTCNTYCNIPLQQVCNGETHDTTWYSGQAGWGGYNDCMWKGQYK